MNIKMEVDMYQLYQLLSICKIVRDDYDTLAVNVNEQGSFVN